MLECSAVLVIIRYARQGFACSNAQLQKLRNNPHMGGKVRATLLVICEAPPGGGNV